MERIVVLIIACAAICPVFGQFNESAPWMSKLDKENSVEAKSIDNSVSLEQISQAFDEYWKNRDYSTKGSGFKPYKRWENYWRHFVKSNGKLPTSKELLSIWERKRNRIGKVVNPVAEWTSIGPFNPGTFGGSLPGTGRINSIAVDPNNPNIWYSGAPAGGIWKSTNSGESWINLFEDFLQIGVSGIAIDRNNSNVIYIATGDDDAADSFSVGVFKSIDAGNSWTETTLGPSTITGWGNDRLMSEIQIDPSNSNIIWVATSFGLYKSIDAGLSWDRKQIGNITDFRLKPGDSDTVYAITNSQFFKSTDGESFTQITDILPLSSGRRVLDVTPANPNIVYVLTAETGAGNFAYQGLYRSSDSGETFVESPNTTNIMQSNQAWFDLALAASATNANEIFMGCLNIWRSGNGGNSFTKVNDWNINSSTYTHADIHTLKFFNNQLFAGTDGGLYVSENNGGAFLDKTNNMAISQFYRISVAKGDNTKIAGGTQDNAGYISNGTQWNVYTGGDGMDYEIDRNNSNLLYGFVQFGNPLFISSDAGQSIGFVNAPRDENGQEIQGNWITPLAVATSGEVYSGYDAVYKLVGNNWEKWSNDFGTGLIDDIEVDPTNPMVIYAAESDFVYRSDDGGVTFSPFNRFDSDISDIAINQTDGSAIYVTTSNRTGIPESSQQASRGVFKVTVNANGDPGPEQDITLNLPTDQSYFAIVHQGRHTDNPIYVATSLGVYRLDDTLTEWEDYFTNLPNTAVSDLEITLDTEIITASTYGRGVWQSPIPVQIPDNDVRIISLSPTNNSVLCGEVNPEIVIENNGLNVINEVEVSYTVNSGTSQTFTWTGTLNSEETTTINVPTLQNVPLGQNEFNVTVSISNDAFADNNTQTNIFVFNDFAFGDTVYDLETEALSLISINEIGEESFGKEGFL